MAEQPLENVVEAGWASALEPVHDDITRMGEFLRAEVAEGRTYLPSGDNVLRAFQQPFDDVRVLIVGQDPYPRPGHPIGLSFSVAPDVRPIPGSLRNIFKEYSEDLGYPRPANGDLSPWADHGILLLNRVLTVRTGKPGSHRGKGWEKVTDQAVRALAERHASGHPLVAILWGNDARSLAPLLGSVPRVESQHPSPMNPNTNFFGSRPFSRANQLLTGLGSDPVDWKLPLSRRDQACLSPLNEAGMLPVPLRWSAWILCSCRRLRRPRRENWPIRAGPAAAPSPNGSGASRSTRAWSRSSASTPTAPGASGPSAATPWARCCSGTARPGSCRWSPRRASPCSPRCSGWSLSDPPQPRSSSSAGAPSTCSSTAPRTCRRASW